MPQTLPRRPASGALRRRIGITLAAAALAVLAAGEIVASGLGLGAAYPGRALVVFGFMALVVARWAPRAHPFDRFGPANVITTVRAAGVSLIASLLLEPVSLEAAWLVVAATVAAVVLDGVDGRLARSTGLSSAFGARFDMETDALLILTLSMVAWHQGKAGAWVIAGGLLRYLFGAAGWWLPWMRRPLTPTRRGRVVAVTHMVALTVVVAPIVRWPWSAVVAGASLALLVWSFAVDVRRLARSGRTTDGSRV